MEDMIINYEILEEIKEKISKEYGSIKKFSELVGIKYTTLRDLLSKNIGKSRVENFIKVCKYVDIPMDNIYFTDVKKKTKTIENITFTGIDKIAADYKGEEFSEESLNEIKNFVEYVRQKNSKK